MTIEVGATIKGTVVKVAEYGAIVRLAEGKSGLIHISEIANTYVRDVREYLAEDDEVTVKVVGISNKGRFELSLKQCQATPQIQDTRPEPIGAVVAVSPLGVQERPRESHPRFSESPPPPRLVTFEDRLTRFLKDSEERQLDLKRHIDAKRGRR